MTEALKRLGIPTRLTESLPPLARTDLDGLTNEARTHHGMNSSPNVSRAGGQNRFLVYVVIWPKDQSIKAGYTATEKRWRSFASHRDGVLFELTAFPSERLARAYEATVLGMLALAAPPRFPSAFDALRLFGRNNGWTEIYDLPVRMADLDRLAGWMPTPYLGDRLWTPEDAYNVLRRRNEEAAQQARRAFNDAIRAAKHRRAAVSA